VRPTARVDAGDADMENGRDDRFHRLPVIPVDVQPVINPNQIVSARLRSNRATPCGMATVSVKRTAFAAVLVCHMSTFAFSQGGPDPDRVKVHVGPVMLSPTITFGNIGYDENVFDEATDPKRDFTVTASPKTEWWLPFMGTWFSGVVNEDLVWYQRYASERGTNTTLGVNWKAPTSRMTVDVGARRARLSDRLNFEIDARPDRLQRSYSSSLALHVLPDTAIEISANKDEIDFDDDELYNGVNLHDQLNRDVTTIRVGASQKPHTAHQGEPHGCTSARSISRRFHTRHGCDPCDRGRDIRSPGIAEGRVLVFVHALHPTLSNRSELQWRDIWRRVVLHAARGDEVQVRCTKGSRILLRNLPAVLRANRRQCRSRAAAVWSG
jgi:hypothetical protein